MRSVVWLHGRGRSNKSCKVDKCSEWNDSETWKGEEMHVNEGNTNLTARVQQFLSHTRLHVCFSATTVVAKRNRRFGRYQQPSLRTNGTYIICWMGFHASGLLKYLYGNKMYMRPQGYSGAETSITIVIHTLTEHIRVIKVDPTSIGHYEFQLIASIFRVPKSPHATNGQLRLQHFLRHHEYTHCVRRRRLQSLVLDPLGNTRFGVTTDVLEWLKFLRRSIAHLCNTSP